MPKLTKMSFQLLLAKLSELSLLEEQLRIEEHDTMTYEASVGIMGHQTRHCSPTHALHCIALHCIALYYIALHCIALSWILRPICHS